MDKFQNIVKFSKEYEILTESKRNDLARIINKLLNDNFIYFHLDSDRQDYFNVLSNKEMIESYLSIMDYELIHDDNFRIFFLKTTKDRNRVHLKKLETIILLLLRRLYDHNLSDVTSLSNITTNMKQIYDAVNETGIYREMPKLTNFQQALKTLKRYKIINFTKLVDEDDLIIIYPTLLHVVNINDITMLNDKIDSYKLNKEVVSDEDIED